MIQLGTLVTEARRKGSLTRGEDEVSVFVQALIARHGLDPGTFIYLSSRDDNLVISRIAVPPQRRGEGRATRAMREILELADARGYVVTLTPSGDFGANKARLTRWYRSLGFTSNLGRRRDFRYGESMIRRPKGGSWNAAGGYASLEELVRKNTGLGSRPDLVSPPGYPDLRVLFVLRTRESDGPWQPARAWKVEVVREEEGVWLSRGFMQVRVEGRGTRCVRLADALAQQVAVSSLGVATVRHVWLNETLQRRGLGTWLYEQMVVRAAREGLVLGTDACNEDGAVSASASATWRRLAGRFPSVREGERVVVWGGGRGSRGVVALAQARTRKDERAYTHYGSLPVKGDDDPLLMAGFTSEVAAKQWAGEVRRVHGRKPAVFSRKALQKRDVEPGDIARWWATGEPLAEVRGSLSPLSVAKAALHNANWWMWGRPFRYMDEAVVLPATSRAAREYADKYGYGDDVVFVFREYGLPDDLSWWREVERETARLGLSMHADSINAGVWVLSPR